MRRFMHPETIYRSYEAEGSFVQSGYKYFVPGTLGSRCQKPDREGGPDSLELPSLTLGLLTLLVLFLTQDSVS